MPHKDWKLGDNQANQIEGSKAPHEELSLEVDTVVCGGSAGDLDGAEILFCRL